MLYFLTGDIQIGKTRWLEGVIGNLARVDVVTSGVIAPGRWVERPEGFVKTGIDNVLLPQGERIAFAEPGNPGWNFDQEAIARVDRHLASLLMASNAASPGFLVVDELGWMELLEGCGLMAALDLIDAGASAAFPHALAVVRESFLSRALDRFARADWGGVRILRPDDASRSELLRVAGNAQQSPEGRCV